MRGKIRNYMAYTCIFIAAFLTGIQNIELPGVYYDAVYPDYLGAIGAFPGHKNFTQITAHLGLPLLGNFYHGTMTAGVQYLVLKCVGHASVYTLRCVNLFYIAFLGCLIYFIIYKVSENLMIALGASVLCVTAENIFTMSRTQYYIMLLGSIFFLISVCFLFDLIQIKNRRIGILLSGVFQGLAFYGYFSYIFLAPISCIWLCMMDGKEKKYVDDSLLFADGILIGSIGYIFGYYDSAIVNFVGKDTMAYILLYAGIAIILLALLLFTLILLRRPGGIQIRFSKSIVMVVLGSVALILGGAFALYRIIPEKIESIIGIFSVTRDRVGGDENFLMFYWDYLSQILSNRSGWKLMFQESGHTTDSVWIWVCLGVSLFTGIVLFIDRKNKKEAFPKVAKAVQVGYAYVFGYYFISLPLIRNMQQQHFVILYFGFFILLGLNCCYLIHFFRPKGYRIFALAVILGLFGLNIYNDRVFLDYLTKTEGRWKYSKTVDTFILQSMTENIGEYVYVFPEWGFNANFIYLTSNQYETIRDADINADILQQKIDDGCKIVIVAWHMDAIDELVSQLNCSIDETLTWYSKEGETLFTSVYLSDEINR